VIALVESVVADGGRVDAAKLADDFGYDVKSMLPILRAAEMLGLVRVDEGDVSVTPLGTEIAKKKGKALTLLKENISKMEPFKTALELIGRNGFATSRQISEALAKRGMSFSDDGEENERIIEEILVRWGIYTDVVKYDGKTALFSPVDERNIPSKIELPSSLIRLLQLRNAGELFRNAKAGALSS